VVGELLFRCGLPSNPHEVFVRLDLVHGSERMTHVLACAAGKPVTEAGEVGGKAGMRLEFELAELVRLLFGTPRERYAGTHRTEILNDAWPPLAAAYGVSMGALMASSAEAVNVVLGAVSDRRPDLGELAVRYGSDKWGMVHWFAPHYDRHLRTLRSARVRVVEIGVGGYANPSAGGESLRMWKRYFPRGLVFGLDIVPKHGVDAPRIRTIQGDQGDPGALRAIAEQHGPFDLVIDDGSHVNEHVLTTFGALFPHVREGGFYVIEDLWTAYCPGFGGDAENLNNAGTSLGLLKNLIDLIHYEEQPRGARHADGAAGDPAYVRTHIAGLHVYHNIAFIEKGVNAEGGIPAWVPRSAKAVNPEPPKPAG
jgi:hypothetical protein